MASGNAYQNAGETGTINYTEIGNQTSTFFVLILAFILLIALLRSEARNRSLLARLAGGGAEGEGACCKGKKRGCCGEGCCGSGQG